MAEQNFVDYVKIMFRSGKGGGGSVHFFRGPAIPKGGPDGGDGAAADILSCRQIRMNGHYYRLNSPSISTPKMVRADEAA